MIDKKKLQRELDELELKQSYLWDEMDTIEERMSELQKQIDQEASQ